MTEPFEIRPHPAAGINGVDLPVVGANRATRHWRLAVDPAAGTVSWQTRENAPLLMRLPGRGPAALPELARLCIADTMDNTDATAGGQRWLVLVGPDGRALTTAAVQTRPVFRALFDDDAFQPLAPYGVEVVQERYDRSRDLERRYPGAEPLLRKVLVDHNVLTTIAVALVVVVLIVLAIAVLG